MCCPYPQKEFPANVRKAFPAKLILELSLDLADVLIVQPQGSLICISFAGIHISFLFYYKSKTGRSTAHTQGLFKSSALQNL